MKIARQWQLTPAHPYTLSVSADARLSRTRYADDQTWHVVIGEGDAPAVTLQTQYGGRAGLVSLVPMWLHDGQHFYQALSYQRPPTIRHFLPDTVVLEAVPLPDVTALMTFRAMESSVLAGWVTLNHQGKSPLSLRFELFGHVGIEGKEQKLSIVELAQGGSALSFGTVVNLHPVVLMSGSSATPESFSPRLGVALTLQPGQSATLRWLHAALGSQQQSLAHAQQWLALDWQPFLAQSDQAAAAVPVIETEQEDWDAVLAASYQTLVQSFLNPAGHLPHSIFVAARTAGDGYSRKGDGSDYGRSWSGQDPVLAYLAAGGIASIAPALAQGVVKNYLAVQDRQTGAVDYKPGPAGQRVGLLCLPVLARLAWHIYEQTEDVVFLREVFPGLVQFFTCWLSQAHDQDGDGLPEWQEDRQTGYAAFPAFAPAQIWGQGAAIQTVETPDLVAYLLSEVAALRRMAARLEMPDADLQQQQARLEAALATLWRNQRYVYRDRDTHETQAGRVLLRDGAGDEVHMIAAQHDPAARLVVRIVGGVAHVPRITLTIEGVSEAGAKITEVLETASFVWLNRQGVATTQRVYAQVHRIRCEGLSRVYRLNVQTMDTTALDMNALLPLIVPTLPKEQVQALVRLATDKQHFWRPNGVTMVSAQDARFDASNARGGGGLWLYWCALMMEGLLLHGEAKRAAELARSLLRLLAHILKQEKAFRQFYNSDSAVGYGEAQHLGGAFPVVVMPLLLGIRIVAPDRVWVGGDFPWGKTVVIRQHGVTVRRTTRKIVVRFASGYKTELPGDAPWQQITDPKAAPTPQVPAPLLPEPPTLDAVPTDATPSAPKRVIIKVELDD